MALKQLMLRKKITSKQTILEEVRTALTGFQTREAELERAIEEASTEEEEKVVEESVEELEKELDEKKAEEKKLQDEIADLEAELKKVEEDAPTPANEDKGEERKMPKELKNRSKDRLLTIRESINIPEVRSFYEGIQSAVKEKRALSGQEQIIPEVVMARIESKIGDYSVLYNEVDVIPLSGKGRIIIDGAVPEAVWIEMDGAISELTDAFEKVELDGYSLAGYIPVPNSTLEDAIINLAAFVEDRLAKAIAKSLDKAILKGTGSADKQPDGVIPKVPAENKVTSNGTLGDIVTKLGLVDTDGTEGEVIAVMSRVTYYKRIMPQLIVTTDDGKTVVPNAAQAMIPGLRVKLSAHMDVDKIVLGAFKSYTLSERAAIRIETSRDVKFIEDQTVFKGVGRWDGKPSKPAAFAEITIEEAPVEETPGA